MVAATARGGIAAEKGDRFGALIQQVPILGAEFTADLGLDRRKMLLSYLGSGVKAGGKVTDA